MSDVQTKTSTETFQLGDLKIAVTTVVTAAGGSAAAPVPGFSEEERAYRECLLTLFQKERGSRLPYESSPEIEQGGMNYGEDGQVDAAILVEQVATGHVIEHWIVMDPTFLEGGTSQLVHQLPNLGVPAAGQTRYDLFKAKYMDPAQNGGLDPAGFLVAHLHVHYNAAPSTVALGPVPPGHEFRVFDLFVLKKGANGQIEETPAGFMHQDIFPIGSLNRIEHWWLAESYEFPSGGLLDDGDPATSPGRTVHVRRRRPPPVPPGNERGPNSVSPFRLPTLKELFVQHGVIADPNEPTKPLAQGSLIQVRSGQPEGLGYTWLPFLQS